ncbi:hypothetical protein [Cystobacter ferrugineus]|uniref:hypothetical protein n=1 Tax=Cystobacter ferrugineus TaxID=83449 RepID=UPI001650E5A6|nr:hypothetical protein [Cystobacter ferrugineus]
MKHNEAGRIFMGGVYPNINNEKVNHLLLSQSRPARRKKTSVGESGAGERSLPLSGDFHRDPMS